MTANKSMQRTEESIPHDRAITDIRSGEVQGHNTPTVGQCCRGHGTSGSVVRRWVGPVTGLMLDLARIGPGSRVLDIAAGDGDQSLIVAQRVGPSGYVLATDIAPKLIAIADTVFRGAGLKNAEARAMDAEDLSVKDASFDAIICGLVSSSSRTCPKLCWKCGVCLSQKDGSLLSSFPLRTRIRSSAADFSHRQAGAAPPTATWPTGAF